MDDFFDNIENTKTSEQLISEENTQDGFLCEFIIETGCFDEKPRKDIAETYTENYLKKIVKRNLDALNLTAETSVVYEIETSEAPECDIHKITEPQYRMPVVSVKVYGCFGTTRDVIDFISALGFIRTIPTRKMYYQNIHCGASGHIKFKNDNMFTTERCNTNMYNGFGENFYSLVSIVKDILGRDDTEITSEIIRHIGQYPKMERGVRALVNEHGSILDNYNIRQQNDCTEITFTVPEEEQEKKKREYSYPLFIDTRFLISRPIDTETFFCESSWGSTSSPFKANINYEGLYKLLKCPPCSVMTTLSITDTVDLIHYLTSTSAPLSTTDSHGWTMLWNKGIVVLNGFNNPKCKFTKQNLVDTLFDEEWYKLPAEYKELINLDVLKTIKTPKWMPNIFTTFKDDHNLTGCAVIYLGQYMKEGKLKEVTLGLYGTTGRIVQQIQKIFTNVGISEDRMKFSVYEKKIKVPRGWPL